MSAEDTDSIVDTFLAADRERKQEEAAQREQAILQLEQEAAAERKAKAEGRHLAAAVEAERRATIKRERQENADELRAKTVKLAQLTARDSLAPAPIRGAIRRQRESEEAKRWLADERSRAIEIPEARGLGDFLATPDPLVKHVVERVWSVGGNIAFSAQKKAGKTRVIHNLARALADGTPFLDEFEVPEQRRVALLDFELAEPMLRQWVREQGIRTPSNVVDVASLKGRVGTFSITNDGVRSRWARKLKDAGTEVLIIDPLRPILRALNLDEWREIGVFLDALDQLKVEADIKEALVAHHHGHGAQRAAGDSSFVGWGDALWNLTSDKPEDPRAWRFFDAYGRGVDVPRGLVSPYDAQRLAFAADAGAEAEARQEQVVEALASWLREQGGEVKRASVIAARLKGVTDKTFSTITAEAERAGLITIRSGTPKENNAKFYSSTVPN